MARHAGPARTSLAHTSHARRRFAAAVLAVVGIAGFGIASAAQLNLTTAPLGAGAQVVATCQSTGTITVSFPTAWSASPPGPAPAAYRVTSVKLEGVNINCANKAYRIQLLDALGAALGPEIPGTTPATIVGNTFTVAITAANQQRAQDLGGVSIVILG